MGSVVHMLLVSQKSSQQTKDEELNSGPTFDSARSLKSFSIHVTEEAIQRSAEVLSRAGFHQSSDTNETVRKMAAMKTESDLIFSFSSSCVVFYFMMQNESVFLHY